jgi:hypothetical protein
MTTLQKNYPTYSNNKNKRKQSFKYNYEPITNTDDYSSVEKIADDGDIDALTDIIKVCK